MKKVIKLTEKDIEGLVKKIIKEEKNKTLSESLDEYQRREMEEGYDSYMGESIFDDISSDVAEMPNDEAMEYLDEVINYCINLREELGYDSYMDDVHEEEKWIQKAIEKPGSLRRKMGVKKGEKLSPSDIKVKLDSLKAKDEDPTKKGVQGLGKRDLETYRQLNLAKTLRGL